MDPDGYTTEVYQGWIWERRIEPGECQDLIIILHGYSPMDYGVYMLQGGDGRYVESNRIIHVSVSLCY